MPDQAGGSDDQGKEGGAELVGFLQEAGEGMQAFLGFARIILASLLR